MRPGVPGIVRRLPPVSLMTAGTISLHNILVTASEAKDFCDRGQAISETVTSLATIPTHPV